MKTQIHSALFGLAVGDALGVPVEFKSWEYLKENPVTDMIGYGTHMQPPGTWSDDSSLTFCLADSLSRGYNLQDQANQFIKWRYEAHWTPYDRVFDIGIATREAIEKMKAGTPPLNCGGSDEYSNCNGSLMRILPLAFYLNSFKGSMGKNFSEVREVSSLTQAHPRSLIACFYYVLFVRFIILGQDKQQAYESLKTSIPYLRASFYEIADRKRYPDSEFQHFSRLLTDDIWNYPESEIQSSGYVVHTIEAAIWCLLTTDSYADCVLKAVNLGDDTDTTAAVAGGLAGLVYGMEGIPENWIQKLAKREEIEGLCDLFVDCLEKMKPKKIDWTKVK